MDQHILAKDLPAELKASMSEAVRFSSVAFLRITEIDGVDEPRLLGSGTLVSAGGTKAILTASHVMEKVAKEGSIPLFLSSGTGLETIDAGGIARIDFGRGNDDSSGPDLAAIVLAPTIASSLAARKTFINLDARRDRILQSVPHVQDGIWLAQGFVEEGSTLTRHAERIDFTLHHFTGVGGPDHVIEVGQHDYVDFPISHDALADGPTDWGGMSGGALWQIPLRKDGDTVSHGRPILAGVLFYQHPTTDTTSGVRGHAWRSVYSVAYDAIAAGRSVR